MENNIRDHYWVDAPRARAYSTSANTYVAEDAPAYLAWQAAGGVPTQHPAARLGDQQAGEAELAELLEAEGLAHGRPTHFIAPLAFMARLTMAEQGAIAAAARTDNAMFVWQMHMTGAQEIDLHHPETVAGMAAIVAAGILTQARADEILAAAP